MILFHDPKQRDNSLLFNSYFINTWVMYLHDQLDVSYISQNAPLDSLQRTSINIDIIIHWWNWW